MSWKKLSLRAFGRRRSRRTSRRPGWQGQARAPRGKLSRGLTFFLYILGVIFLVTFLYTLGVNFLEIVGDTGFWELFEMP